MFKLLSCHIWNLSQNVLTNTFLKGYLMENQLPIILFSHVTSSTWRRVDQNCACQNIFICALGTWKGLNLDISSRLNITVKEVDLKWKSIHLKNQVGFFKLTNLLHTFQKVIASHCFCFVWIVLLSKIKKYWLMQWCEYFVWNYFVKIVESRKIKC